jgi:hypothetical protein
MANLTKTNLSTSSGFHISCCTVSVLIHVKTVKTKKQTNFISVTQIFLFLPSGFRKSMVRYCKVFLLPTELEPVVLAETLDLN